MGKSKFLWSLLILEFFLLTCSARKDVNFVKMAMCPGTRNFPLQFNKVIFTRNRAGQSIGMRMDVLVKKEIKSLKIVTSFWRCRNKENADSCEYFVKDYKASNICQLMGMQNQVWTDFMKKVDLPKKCPLEPGNYSLKNFDIDNENLFRFFPIPNSFWKMNMKGYDTGNNDAYISCVDMDFEVFTVKKE